MDDRIRNLALLLRNDRRIWTAGAFVLVSTALWWLTASSDRSPKRSRMVPELTASKFGLGHEENWNDLIEAFGNEIRQAQKERDNIQAILNRNSENLKQYQLRSGGIFEALVDRHEQLQREIDNLLAAIQIDDATGGGWPKPPIPEPGGLVRIGTWVEPTDPPAPPKLPSRISVITPGDSVQVRLITGVEAPTDGTPYPVLFELLSEIVGPDGTALDVGEARIIAAAQGSRINGRVLYRLTQLAIRHPSGRRSVVEIDGWIVGEDGKRGMAGRLIDKLDEVIAATAAVSAAATLSDRLDDKTQTVVSREGGLVLDRSDIDATAVSAMTNAATLLSQVIVDQYSELVPVVAVRSGREVSAVFSKPAEIEVIDDSALLLAAAQ